MYCEHSGLSTRHSIRTVNTYIYRYITHTHKTQGKRGRKKVRGLFISSSAAGQINIFP